MAINYVTHDDGQQIVLLSGSADALRHITGANVREVVGAIAMQAANLEMTVEVQICRLTKLTDEEARVLLGGAMLEKKFAIFLELAEIKLRHRPKKIVELKTLISELRELNASRTTAIHGGWISWRTREEAMRGVEHFKTTAIKRGKSNKDRRLNIEEAISLAGKISEKSRALVMFVNKTWPRLPPVRETVQAKPRDSRTHPQKSPKRK